VKKTPATKIAVIGAGISGVTTSRLLQRHGYDVTIYTKATPPYVTSSFAGAGWSPTATLVEEGKFTPEFKTTSPGSRVFPTAASRITLGSIAMA